MYFLYHTFYLAFFLSTFPLILLSLYFPFLLYLVFVFSSCLLYRNNKVHTIYFYYIHFVFRLLNHQMTFGPYFTSYKTIILINHLLLLYITPLLFRILYLYPHKHFQLLLYILIKNNAI